MNENNTNIKITNNTTHEPINNDNEGIKFSFSEVTIRRAFSIKVFSILTILLGKTLAYSAVCMYYKPLKYYLEDNPNVILYPIPFYFICAFALIFKPSLRRCTPWNYIILLLFSTCTSIMVGGISAIFAEEMILIGFAITTVLVLGLTLFAFQTKWDFTQNKMFVFSFILLVILMILTSMSFVNNSLKLMSACLGVIIFSTYLIIDIQQIINGNHAYKISPEDHILAVTILYLDIINIFLNILKLLK